MASFKATKLRARNIARHNAPRGYSKLVKDIAACAFCDNGALIQWSDVESALDADRGSGFDDPTHDEVTLLIQGSADGMPPPELCAAHPALDALLAREMT